MPARQIIDMDRIELEILDYPRALSILGFRWGIGPMPVENQGAYIRANLARVPEENAQRFVEFCRLVCAAVGEKGENDALNRN